MVENRPTPKIALAVLGAGAMIQLISGVLAGVHDDWMRMSLFLFGGVLTVFFGMMFALMIGLQGSFGRLEERFQIARTTVPTIVRRVQMAVGVIAVVSVLAHMSLSIVAGFRSEWLRLALHLAACAITAIVCTGILTTLGIGSRLLRLEQRLSDKTVDLRQSL
ncbi:MAG: hypothetical protein ABFE13_03640 [Phycisphaerales bacterium]